MNIKAAMRRAGEWVKKSPFVQGVIGGLTLVFILVVAMWALAWLIDFLPWPSR